MDNLENYLYVLFAVIYIISRIIKARSKQKKEQQPPSQASRVPHQQNQPKPKKAFSFEDILKEFEKNLAGEEEHEKPLPVEEIRYEQPAPIPVKKVKESPKPYDAYQGDPYRSIKEEIEIDKEKESSYVRSENYKIKTDVASEYVKMLQDPQGFKNAIVMSEIINRKYF